MLALHFQPDPTLDDRTPRPLPAADEALIALRVAGVCDTDLQLSAGYMDFRGIPGHEFVGQVVECEDSAWIGRRVVGDINAGCGECADCREAQGHHCSRRSVLGIVGRPGCFAEFFTLPIRNLVAVPDAVPDDAAVFAEPLAAGLHVLDVLGKQRDERVAVLGDGKLGLLTAMALHGAGIATTLIGHHENKLSIAREAGVTALLESALQTTGPAFDSVVEATGSPSGLERAMELVRPGGNLILKSTMAGGCELDLSPIVIHEIRLIGSRCGDMRQAMRALEEGRVDPRPLINERYPLAQAVQAVGHAARRGTLKVLIEGPALA